MRRIRLSLFPALPLLVLLVCPWFGAVAPAQLREWQVRGRMQYRALHDSRTGGEDVLRRARFWTNGFVAPDVSMRFQYDFVSERVLDFWVAYEPSPAIEVRLGQSWLPFIGDFTTAPFFLDTIDFSAGSSLTPPREKGLFVLGEYKGIEYNVSVVNGNGFHPDENSRKDVFGFIKAPILSDKLLLGVGHYEGRAGPDERLTIERRTAADFEARLHRRLTLKGAYLRGIDDRLITNAYWLRALVHIRKRIDLIGEYDAFLQGPATSKWITAGVNFHFPLPRSNVKVHFRRFTVPAPYSEVKMQLQIIAQFPWK